jgi:hypothetical protein
MSYHVSISINAPTELIWSELIDVERWPQSTASITSVTRLESGAFQLGSSARIKQPQLPPMVWKVTNFQPAREFTWWVTSAGVTTIAAHKLSPGPGSSVTLTLSIDRVGLLAPLIDLLFDGLTRRYVNMEAAGMKRVCEAKLAAATGAAA